MLSTRLTTTKLLSIRYLAEFTRTMKTSKYQKRLSK